MKKIFLIALFIISCNLSSQNNSATNWAEKYNRIEASELKENPIKFISDWMLVTAGNKESFNMMTASWGGVGFLWELPVSFITIRDTRYTYQFIQNNESYTLSFFPEKYKNALQIAGTKSGRDTDKVKATGLIPIKTPNGLMSFAEAHMIIECKKLYAEPMKKDAFVDKSILDKWYKDASGMHTLFLSEITNVWIKK